MDQKDTHKAALRLIAILQKQGFIEQSVLDRIQQKYGEKVKDADLKSAS